MSTILIVGKDSTLAGSTAIQHHTTTTDNAVSVRTYKQAVGYLDKHEVQTVLVLQSKRLADRIYAHWGGNVKLLNLNMNDTAIRGLDGWLLRRVATIRGFIHQCGTRRFWLLPAIYGITVAGWLLRLVGRELMIVRWYTTRIGHLAYNSHVVMSEAAKHPHPIIIGVQSDYRVSSQQLCSMYERRMTVSTKNSFIARFIYAPAVRRSRFYYDANWWGDVHKPLQQLDNDKVYLTFTDEECEYGRQLQTRTGLTDWWVCIHARDSSYLDAYDPHNDWEYHNFRDCDIQTYMQAADDIKQQGGQSVRMGAIVDTALLSDSPAIDYATRHRSDFGDIWLLAHCRYLLGSCAGVTQVATVFGVPVAIANWTHCEFMTCFRDGDIIIPKGVWHVGEKRFLTLPQILQSGAGRYIRAEQYEKAGLELVDSTADEIAALSTEMLMRLNGDWVDTEEQIAQHGRFQAIINNPEYRCCGSPVRIGAQYLSEHPEWLG